MVKMTVGSDRTGADECGAFYVEVVFAKTTDEAERYRRLLEQKSIPSMIEPASELPSPCGVAVLVPGDQFIEATEVLTMMSGDDDDFEIDDDEDEADDDFSDDDDLEFDDDDDDLDEEDDDELEEDDEF